MSSMTSLEVLKTAMKDRGFIKPDGEPDAVRLADESGVDVSLIRRYLYGEVEIGSSNAPRLAEILHVDVVRLLYGGGKTASSRWTKVQR